MIHRINRMGWRRQVAGVVAMVAGLVIGAGAQYPQLEPPLEPFVGPALQPDGDFVGPLLVDPYRYLYFDGGDLLYTANTFRPESVDRTQLTVAAWVKSAAAASSLLIRQFEGGASLRNWWLSNGYRSGNNGKISVVVCHSNAFASRIEINSQQIVFDDTWHHYAFTFLGSGGTATVRLFVDGVEVPSVVTDNANNGTINPQLIPTTITSSNLSDIAQVVTVPRAVSDAEMLAIYRGEMPADASAYWPFDPTNRLLDQSGNDVTLTDPGGTSSPTDGPINRQLPPED